MKRWVPDFIGGLTKIQKMANFTRSPACSHISGRMAARFWLAGVIRADNDFSKRDSDTVWKAWNQNPLRHGYQNTASKRRILWQCFSLGNKEKHCSLQTSADLQSRKCNKKDEMIHCFTIKHNHAQKRPWWQFKASRINAGRKESRWREKWSQRGWHSLNYALTALR